MATLFTLEDITKTYGTQTILHDASLAVGSDRKIGVIGRNGAGKSTLFKILLGKEAADSGTVKIHPGTRIGYLEQHDPYKPEDVIIDFLTDYTGKADWECGKVAHQFQLDNEMLYRQIGQLSGGFQMRVKLTAMLLREPNLLLLDEPTNYLDLSTLLLLERFLLGYRGGYLVISHDREFLKRVTDETLEVERGQLFLYPQPLEEYLAYKIEQTQQQARSNVKVEREQQHLKKFIDRFGAKASKATQAKSKQKKLDKLSKIEILAPLNRVKIFMPAVEAKKGRALKIDDLSIGYPGKVIADKIVLDIERGEHIAILGDNGQGKTTFLRTIAEELPGLGGSFRWHPHLKIGYYAQHVPQALDPKQKVGKYLEAAADIGVHQEEVMKMAGNFLFRGSDLDKTISLLSGGEKARLCLAGLLLAKNQVLLLDEPSNHLDFETVEAMAVALQKSNCTLLFISHDRTFVNMVAKRIIEVKNGQVSRYYHNYEEYVYYLAKATEEDDKPEKVSKPEQKKKKKKGEKKTVPAQTDEMKARRKEVRRLEQQISKAEIEKTNIMKDFEENPHTYSAEQGRKLQDIEKQLAVFEQDWLAATDKLEAL